MGSSVCQSCSKVGQEGPGMCSAQLLRVSSDHKTSRQGSQTDSSSRNQPRIAARRQERRLVLNRWVNKKWEAQETESLDEKEEDCRRSEEAVVYTG